jgi:phosphatidylglycerol:prolipoprotein diacylglycerol transferase
MVHHPLIAGVGAACALAVAAPYALGHHLPLRNTADAFAAPIALALACEQLGALLAGSGYGTETDVRWAVVYTHPLAARWSGAPLFDPVHPVQAYAALSFLAAAVLLYFLTSRLRRAGDAAGAAMIVLGAAVYFTEFFRDPEGRGALFGGAIDGPQIAAAALVLLGPCLLWTRRERRVLESAPTASEHAGGSV